MFWLINFTVQNKITIRNNEAAVDEQILYAAIRRIVGQIENFECKKEDYETRSLKNYVFEKNQNIN